ncbi:unnamed protein product, partial [Prorocentrum cordatum]
PRRTADAVGKLVEVLSDSKRARAEVPGLLVEDPTGTRTLLSPDELGSFTQLSACQVEQCQRFSFPHSLAVLGRSLRSTYDDVVVVDGTLVVCECVRVSHSQGVLCIKWE